MSPVPEQASNWSMGTHLAGLSWAIGIPFGGVLGPLVVWLLKKDEMPSVDHHGKEAINFGISTSIYMLVSGILCFVFIGIPLLLAVMGVAIVCPILAAVRAREGRGYEYPFTIRFLS